MDYFITILKFQSKKDSAMHRSHTDVKVSEAPGLNATATIH